jgi:hypothetical protein
MAERAPKEDDISTTLRNVAPPESGENPPEPEVNSEALTKKRVTLGSDTLLSAPASAEEAEAAAITDRDEKRQDERVDELERRVDQLEARVGVLELRQPSQTPRWLIWVLFLFGLALAFQLTRQL